MERHGKIDFEIIVTFLGNPKPILKWSSSSKRLMKIIQTSNTAKFSSHQLVNRKQSLVSKTSSTLKIESLERGDHHSEIKCVAVNTNLTRPPEKSIRINLLRKLIYLYLLIITWYQLNAQDLILEDF